MLPKGQKVLKLPTDTGNSGDDSEHRKKRNEAGLHGCSFEGVVRSVGLSNDRSLQVWVSS